MFAATLFILLPPWAIVRASVATLAAHGWRYWPLHVWNGGMQWAPLHVVIADEAPRPPSHGCYLLWSVLPFALAAATLE